MGITVSDIEQKEFTFKGAGYDPYDVDSYLDQICDEMIAMQDRIDALEAELKQARAAAEAQAESVKPMPQEIVKEETPIHRTSETLESILLSAQRISDEAIDNAKKRAEEIVNGAEGKASEILGNVQEEKGTLEKEILSLKAAAGDYKKRFLSLLNEHKSLLEAEDSIFEKEEENEPEDGAKE